MPCLCCDHLVYAEKSCIFFRGMAPRTRKQVAKRRTNNVPRDVDGMEENGHHQIEQEPEAEVSQQPIQKQG